ncbi:DUF3325 domain-containing protein [Rugamonas aquatica]|uniref:DUF3325 family protein n=1 Tax=Rugamonas aquatica TaxID=2743357 RepID=A0A6A7N0N2_9BURK|nr:DUF3325 domain-containing protein [Rugamonas aquatica]MQA38546.1 DUF3325 family protein [Rugamonas aquatica]
MNYALTVAAALLLASSGMTALALAIDRHHRQVYGADATPGARLVLRVAGAVLLALAICPCVLLWGAGAGIVAWTGMLTAGALVPALALAYHPRRK